MADYPSVRQSIGLVVPAFDKGGLEQVVLNLYLGYRSLGHDCVVLVENNVSGYMAKRLDCKHDVVIFNGNETVFLKTCVFRQITVLHYHYSTYLLEAMKNLGFYTIYTMHNIYTWLDDAAFTDRANRILAANRIVAVSRFVRDYFCFRKGIDKDHVEVISNGVDLAALKPKSSVMRAYLDLAQEGFIFANIASTHRNKHQALVIRAAELLLKMRRDFFVILVGNMGDAKYHEEIEAILAASEARKHVRFIPFISADKLGSFYRDVVDCVLLPSLQEGCSNVVLEALATDRTMILTDVGNAREAAVLSKRVRIISPAYATPQVLTPATVDKLSRTGDAPNLNELVKAMFDVIENRLPPTEQTQLDICRRSIDAESMVSSYAGLFGKVPLLVN